MTWNGFAPLQIAGFRPDDAKLVHYTIGGPYFDEYADCEYSGEWFAERDAMLRCDQRSAAEQPIKKRA